MGALIAVEFPREVGDAAAGRRVVALARGAASGLARWSSRPVRLRLRDGRVATAAVAGEAHRLVVAVGLYGGEVGWDVSADVEWLCDQSLATEGGFGSERAEAVVAGPEEALAWVCAHCLRSPVERVPVAVLELWETEQVRDPARGRISLAEAVKVYGCLLGRRISAEALAAEGMSRRDAARVAEAVRRVLPREREAK